MKAVDRLYNRGSINADMLVRVFKACNPFCYEGITYITTSVTKNTRLFWWYLPNEIAFRNYLEC